MLNYWSSMRIQTTVNEMRLQIYFYLQTLNKFCTSIPSQHIYNRSTTNAFTWYVIIDCLFSLWIVWVPLRYSCCFPEFLLLLVFFLLFVLRVVFRRALGQWTSVSAKLLELRCTSFGPSEVGNNTFVFKKLNSYKTNELWLTKTAAFRKTTLHYFFSINKWKFPWLTAKAWFNTMRNLHDSVKGRVRGGGHFSCIELP